MMRRVASGRVIGVGLVGDVDLVGLALPARTPVESPQATDAPPQCATGE